MSEQKTNGSMDEMFRAMERKLDETTAAVTRLSALESLDQRISTIEKRLDEAVAAILSLNNVVKHLAESCDMEVISKRIDDLQQYIAGLSQTEERFQDMMTTFDETKEIVSIIVSQLDSLERKHNKVLADISSTIEMISRFLESEPSATRTAPTIKEPAKSPVVEAREESETRVFQDPLPSTIDGLMDRLLKVVTPQTEAATMAKALEEIRDQLTTIIQGHTPVFFQFGKIARELKSYPPTATLNENDIARLNKEIRSWTVKLKEIAREA